MMTVKKEEEVGPKFQIQIVAFRSTAGVVDGKRVEVGDRVGGWSTASELWTLDYMMNKKGAKKYCDTLEEVVERSRWEWSKSFKGFFKQLTIKSGHETLMVSQNYLRINESWRKMIHGKLNYKKTTQSV